MEVKQFTKIVIVLNVVFFTFLGCYFSGIFNSCMSEADIEPFSKAVADGNYSEVKAFIEKNPFIVNAPLEVRVKGQLYSVNDRALHVAANNGYLNIVKLLLEHGADPNLTDNWNETPLHRAALAPENRVEIAKSLIEGGAKLDIRNYQARTALDIAKSNNYQDLVKFLESTGAH